MKRYCIVGNWKMNKTIAETEAFVNELKQKLPKTKNEVVICPSYLSIAKAVECANGSIIKVGAQNMHYEDSGVYTGEVGASMLKEVGATYCIIGHSSRRQFDNDTDEKISKKLNFAIESGITPILCIGENAKEKAQNRTYRVIKKQLLRDFEGVSDPSKVIVAYEPLWAISDGKTPAPTPTMQEIAAVNSGIKRVLKQMYDKEFVKNVKILYGGSVNPSNAEQIFSIKSVNGVLIGGACLNVDKFISIINASIKK